MIVEKMLVLRSSAFEIGPYDVHVTSWADGRGLDIEVVELAETTNISLQMSAAHVLLAALTEHLSGTPPQENAAPRGNTEKREETK